jgi:capsule polysaccharide export protein KpsE/RkpR
LIPPEAQSASSFGGFGSIGGDLMGVSSTNALLVAMMRSQTLEDRIIDRFELKQVYRIGLQREARTRLEIKTSFRLDPKNGIVTLSVTDDDPQRAAAMARAYIQELEALMAQLNNSSAHRERVFLQDRLQLTKLEMEAAERDFSEFARKNRAIDIP